MLFGVDVSCILYSIVSYLNVNSSRSISSIGEEKAIFCYRLLVIIWFLFGGVSSSFGALDGLCYFVVASPGPSI